MSSTEITQEAYQAVMQGNPSRLKGPQLPVVNVTWQDAVRFCMRMSELEGLVVRLPTEAEWEYACRAGTDTSYYSGDDEASLDRIAWHKDNSDRRYHRVGRKRPNAWGLYDMHGNVEEWCEDWYSRDYYAESPGEDPRGPAWGADRVFRGGSYGIVDHLGLGLGGSCRAAFRNGRDPHNEFSFATGFRVVIEAHPPASEVEQP